MLVLSRKNDQSVVIGGSDLLQNLVKVTVLGISDGCVKLGFEANKDVVVHREEVWERIRGGGRRQSPGTTEDSSRSVRTRFVGREPPVVPCFRLHDQTTGHRPDRMT